MEVVEGDEVDPREFTAPGQWFQCRGKKVVPLEKSRREIEAEQFRLRQAGRKLAAFSVEKQEAQILEGADKIILRPKSGLDRLLQRGPAYLTRMIKASAGVNIQETEEEDIVIPNTKQYSILIATTSGERKMKYVSINLIKLGEEEQVPVFAYVATPDGCGKGVVHGVDRIFTQEEIMQMLRHKANPEVIG
ncbi:hypothetical protein V5799_013695, partial [Amblyomma americanum]